MVTRILVPLDGTPMSEEVLPYATGLAKETGSTVHLVQVVKGKAAEARENVGSAAPLGGPTAPSPEPAARQAPGSEYQQAEEYMRNAGASLAGEGLSAGYEVRQGEPVDELLRVAEEQGVDIIAIATRGRTGLGRALFGSVADELLRRSGRPVMVVKAKAA